MAILHVAYTFEPQSFLAKLEQELVFAGKLQYRSLVQWARQVASKPSAIRRHMLEMIRFDPEVLNAAESNPQEYSRELFMAVLVGELKPVTSLGTRQLQSYHVLRNVLPGLGWKNETIERLIRGDSLDTLVRLSNNEVLIREFCDLRQFGGWLDSAAILEFSQMFTSVKEEFCDPRESLLTALAETSRQLSVAGPVLLERAYLDATEMLENAIKANKALFLVLD